MGRARVTLIPGAAGSHAFWDPIARRLDSSFEVLALDLPGLGNIPAQSAIASYDDLVDDVAAKIQPSSAVVAQSMGAYVALQLALRYPQMVTHLGLTAATGGVGALRLGAEDWRSDYATTYPNAASWARSHVRDLSDDELSRITIPVLLLWPTHDALSPLSIARRLTERLPDARLRTFDSDDHWFVHHFADQIASEIGEFTRLSA